MRSSCITSHTPMAKAVVEIRLPAVPRESLLTCGTMKSRDIGSEDKLVTDTYTWRYGSDQKPAFMHASGAACISHKAKVWRLHGISALKPSSAFEASMDPQ